MSGVIRSGDLMGGPTIATRSEPPPEPGSARREVRKRTDNRIIRRFAGSVNARMTNPAGEEGARGGPRGPPALRAAPEPAPPGGRYANAQTTGSSGDSPAPS